MRSIPDIPIRAFTYEHRVQAPISSGGRGARLSCRIMNTLRASLEEEQVRIPCADAVLDGDVTIPADARGLVVFAHGSGSSRRSPRNRLVAREMNGKRLATLLFDLLTPAEAAADARTGGLRFDIPFLTKRLAAATLWARSHPQLRRLGIGYFGASTGAAAALAAAARIPEIQAVVSRGGRTDLTGDAISRVMAPTLLIAGSLDEAVVRWNRKSLERLPCVKRLALVEGATHLFSEPGALERVADLAANWFSIHLTPTNSGS
jgi:dienelactone hydrolase